MPMRPRLPIAATFFLAVVPFGAAAQMHHVEKTGQVTRAVSVYEWTGELAKPTAARVVPVTVFIDGEFEDGGTYLARPVPFALAPGNLYSVEAAGNAEGVVEVRAARKLSTSSPDPDQAETGAGSWYGYGAFKPPVAEKPKKLKASKQPISIDGLGADDEDSEPHFVAKRPSTDEAAAPAANRRPHPTSNDADDPERPTLARRDDAVADNKAKKPKRDKPAGYVSGVGDLNEDPDRPTLRHGKEKSDDAEMLTGLPADMHQAIAVSDAGARPAHVFARAWESDAEREQVLAAMRALATERLKPYLVANALVPAKGGAEAVPVAASAPGVAAALAVPAADDTGVPPKLARTPGGVNTATHSATPVAPAAAARVPGSRAVPKTAVRLGTRKAAVAGVPLALGDEDLHGFQLSYGGLPTFVYTADAPVAMAKDGTALRARVAVVAQRLPEGRMQVALATVTDSAHLNRAPWMRFVDVVDADGSNRASLLFERRASATRDFALYRLVTAKAEPSFSTAPLE